LRRNTKLIALPLAFACGLFALWVALIGVPGAWLFAVLVYVPHVKTSIVILILIAIASVAAFWRYHRVSGSVMAASLIALYLLIAVPTPGQSVARFVADLAQILYYRTTLQELARAPSSNGSRHSVVALEMDGFGSMTSGIAIDPTGEILLPPKKRSSAWREAAGETELDEETIEVRHIVGSYYSWFHY